VLRVNEEAPGVEGSVIRRDEASIAEEVSIAQDEVIKLCRRAENILYKPYETVLVRRARAKGLTAERAAELATR
jgi:hypothetical protein